MWQRRAVVPQLGLDTAKEERKKIFNGEYRKLNKKSSPFLLPFCFAFFVSVPVCIYSRNFQKKTPLNAKREEKG